MPIQGDPLAQLINFMQQRAMQDTAIAADARARGAQALAQGIHGFGSGIASGLKALRENQLIEQQRQWELQDQEAQRNFALKAAEHRAETEYRYKSQFEDEQRQRQIEHITKLDELQQQRETARHAEEAARIGLFMRTGNPGDLPPAHRSAYLAKMAENRLRQAMDANMTPEEYARTQQLLEQRAALESGQQLDVEPPWVVRSLGPQLRTMWSMAQSARRFLTSPFNNRFSPEEKAVALKQVDSELQRLVSIARARRQLAQEPPPQLMRLENGYEVIKMPDGRYESPEKFRPKQTLTFDRVRANVADFAHQLDMLRQAAPPGVKVKLGGEGEITVEVGDPENKPESTADYRWAIGKAMDLVKAETDAQMLSAIANWDVNKPPPRIEGLSLKRINEVADQLMGQLGERYPARAPGGQRQPPTTQPAPATQPAAAAFGPGGPAATAPAATGAMQDAVAYFAGRVGGDPQAADAVRRAVEAARKLDTIDPRNVGTRNVPAHRELMQAVREIVEIIRSREAAAQQQRD